MSGDDTGTEVVIAEVGPCRIALPVDAIVGVDLPREAPQTDAFQALEVERGAARVRRLRLRAEIPFDLLVGSGIRVVRLDSEDLQPLPAFLSGLQDLVGLVGFAAYKGSFALVIDHSRLEPA